MRIALGSDMPAELAESVDRWLRARGHHVERFGALVTEKDEAWPSVATAVAASVARGQADSGVLCCWTGTGVSIAANKVPGVRAALCNDAGTAAGARQWNDANVLCLSLRATTPALAEEMLDSWFSAHPTDDPAYQAMIEEIRAK
ncbi:MAG: RpiB/LacA/LacB family sugar-phosphate isomerase [Candidatus Eremiobacteraeota bacterium]|nr:RpiB/LacA/LacB family sugar-phosphate isomerase [Candidatus Eremiobacteraeota bacterium]